MLAARLIKQRKYSCTYVVLSTLHKIALRALVGRIKYLVSSNTFPYLFQKYLPQKNIQNEQERCYTLQIKWTMLTYDLMFHVNLRNTYRTKLCAESFCRKFTLSWPCFFVLLWISGRRNTGTRHRIYLNCISIWNSL